MFSRLKFPSTLFIFVVICCVAKCCYCHDDRKNGAISLQDSPEDPDLLSDYRFFLRYIFKKYGTTDSMTFEGFEHLLQNLGLLFISGHDLKDHREGSEAFRDKHPNHEHSQSYNSYSGSTKGSSEQKDSSHPHNHSHHFDHHNHAHNPNQPHDHNHDSHDHENHDAKKPKISEIWNTSSFMDVYREFSNQDQRLENQCLSPADMYLILNMRPNSSLNPITFLILCPAIIYELDQRQCQQSHSEGQLPKIVTWEQWLAAVGAVVVISLCGLFSVALIPIMQKWFYHTLLQFLVGLAVGSLSGDAVLHLLPHAMIGMSHDEHDHGHDDGKETFAVWVGFCGLVGLYGFFLTERFLSIISTSRRRRLDQKKLKLEAENMVAFNTEDTELNGNVGEKLSQYRKNSYNTQIMADVKETMQMLPEGETVPGINSRRGSRRSSHEVAFHGRSSFSADPMPGALLHQASLDPEKFMVTVSDHHGHSHGHSHEVPQSVSAVAWMVIMGDGLHNFCDGIAIGAAFGMSLSDGISTTIAVFCHELPHELGDFAMLLKTGMKVKQAMFYNLVSSVLCLLGMIIGVSLGGVPSATTWIFAGTAGMFIYIALVDMLPELVTVSDDPGSTACFTLAMQVLGISTGVTIMLTIALFENTIKSMFS